MIAEGIDGQSVIFTSLDDVSYGAGGTFDTANRRGTRSATVGDWGGIYAGHTSTLAMDYSRVSFAGGTTRIDGGFASFNPVEIHQAEARIAHSRFVNNANGGAGAAPTNRAGRGTNFAATIFVRGSQPILVENQIVNNLGAAISIDVNSLNRNPLDDYGRSTGSLGSIGSFAENQGPLIRGNRLDRNPVNGLLIRGQELTTQSIWDDSDIVHVVRSEIEVNNFHTYGGLQVISKGSESVVVKLEGSTAGFTADGLPLDLSNRIGGAVNLIGAPGAPVILTSLNDCSVGAGFTPEGFPQTDTLNTGFCTATAPTPFADVIVVMDESGSMAFAQQFSVGLIADLDAALLAAGIGTTGGNRFGLVGYGNADEIPRSIPVGATELCLVLRLNTPRQLRIWLTTELPKTAGWRSTLL